ncbi:MAG: hypothetical protein SFY32_06860 [Bacteroidota bacterium]|nr:hypothetical protein [Bacteroidota bacterium]
MIDGDFSLEGGDFWSIFSQNGILIGITSSGDTYDLVHDNLKYFIDEGCIICVCACRTYDRIPPGTNAAIFEFTDYSNIFIEKTISANPENEVETNNIDAEKLLIQLNEILRSQ